jgi:lipoprotein-releasing system ATP-binding protein
MGGRAKEQVIPRKTCLNLATGGECVGNSGDINNKGGRPRVVARVEGVHRYFDTPDGILEVLRGINLTVTPGRMVAIVGASGVGKSTLLHILGGLDPPTRGQVYWGNQSPYELADERRAHHRNLQIGFVFQFHHLLPEFTALENVALPLIIRGEKWRSALSDAANALSGVGLGNRANHLPGEMSGGEQQRAAVARAVVTGAPLVIADEPSGNLDRRTAEQLHDLLGTLVMENGHALVVATHNPDLARRADEVLAIQDGVLCPAVGGP